MKFENLPNEYLLDMFAYFNSVHLFRTFFGLNNRFNSLLHHSTLIHHFDFESISKKQFDSICQQYLPLVIEQIHSIGLSNSIETPEQIGYFRSYHFTFDRFINLKTICLSYISFDEIFDQILQECRSLTHLTALRIDHIRNQYDGENICQLFNLIWTLPKLTHFYLTNVSATYSASDLPISSTLRVLVFDELYCSVNQIYLLFKSTPQLSQLNISIKHLYVSGRSFEPISSSLKILKIRCYSSRWIDIISLFQNLPDLSELTCELHHFPIVKGYEWKAILSTCLPNLKIFRFLMICRFNQSMNRERVIDEILGDYRTSFWINNERQWFVRCDWTWRTIVDSREPYLVLYTLPYFLGSFRFNEIGYSKSTCSNEFDFWSYDSVDDLRIEKDDGFIQYISQYPIRFPRIQHLSILYHLLPTIQSIFPSFDHLISLDIRYDDENLTETDLIHSMSNLSSIQFHQYHPSQLNLDNPSIRQVYFPTHLKFNQFTLFPQCEVLRIGFHHREILIDILQTMKQLRSISFTCYDAKNDLIEWLRKYFPSHACITRNDDMNMIQIWL